MSRRDGLLQLVDRLDALQDEIAKIKTAIRTYVEPPEHDFGQDDDGPLTPDTRPAKPTDANAQSAPPQGLGV